MWGKHTVDREEKMMKQGWKWVMVLKCCSTLVFADAFQEGKTLVEGKPTVESFASTGITASENPAQVQYTDNQKMSAAVEHDKHSNEAFQQIKEANETREIYDITLEDSLYTNMLEKTGDALGAERSTAKTNRATLLKTCMKSGESYTKTCRRQRLIEIKVTPEVRATNPRYCLGHWNWSGTSKSHCNGCKGGDSYISQHKKVDITRDEWVGCEDLEALHDAGKADIISETMGAENEARVIDGESITRDYWETTRTYALNTETFNECEALQALGCIYQDGVCAEYTNGMAGARICKRYKMTYKCALSAETKVSHRPDLDLTLPPTQTAVANHNMTNALSQMEAMRQMAKHMEGNTEASLRIFRGESKRCSTNFGGSFKDCCTSDGGTGTVLHIATECTAEEKQLAEARSQKRCVFVGARQKNQTLGMNVSKEYIYCCYPNKLGLAIQKGARAQLGRNFGTAESPQCEGLTPDELSRVDFSQVDLSETFADIMASAQKMSREVKVDLAQKQRQFKQPSDLSSLKANQHAHKRVYTDPVEGEEESHDITY